VYVLVFWFFSGHLLFPLSLFNGTCWVNGWAGLFFVFSFLFFLREVFIEQGEGLGSALRWMR